MTRDTDIDVLLQERDELLGKLHGFLSIRDQMSYDEWSDLVNPLDQKYAEVTRQIGDAYSVHAYDIAEELSNFLLDKILEYKHIDRVVTSLESHSEGLSVEFSLPESLLKSLALGFRIKAVAKCDNVIPLPLSPRDFVDHSAKLQED